MKQNPASDLVACSLFLQALILFGMGIRMLSFIPENKFYVMYCILMISLSVFVLFVGLRLLRRNLFAWVLAIGLQVILLFYSLFSGHIAQSVQIPIIFLSGFTLFLCGVGKPEILFSQKEAP